MQAPKTPQPPLVAPVRVNESSKAERKHPGQRPKAAVRIGREKRDEPRHDIANDLIILAGLVCCAQVG